MRMTTQRRYHMPHALLSPMGQGRAGPMTTRIGAVATRMCAWQRWAWLAPCGLCCVGALGLLHIQAARASGWRSGCWPHHGRPARFDPTRRLGTRRSAPGPRAPRTAPRGRCVHAVHATIARGRRHLRVTLEMSTLRYGSIYIRRPLWGRCPEPSWPIVEKETGGPTTCLSTNMSLYLSAGPARGGA